MAIYHLEAKVVSRGAGRSAVAASAYLSCSRLYNDYDGIQHDYTKKQGLVWQEVFLPEYAPQEWQDREKLWNAVEEVETAKDSRLAREFVVALPIELNREEQLAAWRAVWADVSNRCLERAGHEERIDHRSHADRGLTEQPTIHEGVVARALEKKGIISDRCEINRQIKADNALLRELKATVKKLMQTVKNSVPAIAEAMEKLRGSMLIFSYQLRHIGIGKHNIGRRVKAIKPELERYTGLVQQIKAKSKECKNLLAEKKETPFYQIPKLHDLSHRIAELTEELEELNTEKEMLLRSLDCADDTGISSVKKDIAAMESALKKLEAQEAKYSAELDAALKEYSGLKEQASEFDAGELMEARLSIRGEKERSAVTRVQDAYGEKYDSLMMFDSKRDVANLLHEEAEAHSVRERLRQKQQTKTQRQRKPKHYEQER